MLILWYFAQFLDLPWHPALTKFIADHMMVEVGDSKQGSKKYIHTQSEVRLMREYTDILWTKAYILDQQ